MNIKKRRKLNKCTQNLFEELEMVWEDRYERQRGFWRPYVKDVILSYLDCCDFHNCFTRVKCHDCNYEYLLRTFHLVS
jgi:hypothetical protein